jgi:hypothetical protein
MLSLFKHGKRISKARMLVSRAAGSASTSGTESKGTPAHATKVSRQGISPAIPVAPGRGATYTETTTRDFPSGCAFAGRLADSESKVGIIIRRATGIEGLAARVSRSASYSIE